MAAKQEQAVQSEHKILEAAFRVLAENSISGSSASKIAKRAGVSKPLLFYHFSGKEEILERVLKNVLERLLEIPLENANKNLKAYDEIKGIFKRYKRTITDDPDLLIVFYDFWVKGAKEGAIREMIANRFEAFRVYLSQLVSEGVERGEFSPEKSHMIPPLMLSFLEGASVQLISDSNAFNYDLYQYMALEMISFLSDHAKG